MGWGQKLIACCIVLGATGIVIWIRLDSSATSNASTKPQELVARNVHLPHFELNAINAAAETLCGKLDADQIELQCVELIRTLNPNERLTPSTDQCSLVDRRRDFLARLSANVTEYTNHTQDPPAIREQAVALIEQLNQQTAMLTVATPLPELADKFRKLIEIGSNDPVLRNYEISCRDSKSGIETFEALRDLAFELRDLPYSNSLKQAVCRKCLAIESKNAPLNDRRLVAEMYGDFVGRTLAECGGTSQQLADFMEMVIYPYFNMDLNVQLVVLNTLADRMDINPYFANMLAGNAARELSWRSRGSGYASTVPEDDWTDFVKQQRRAMTHFKKAWTLQPSLPYAPNQLIGIARSSSVTNRSSRDWFNITTTVQFDFQPAYYNFRIGMFGKWGGSIDEAYAFANECIETAAFQTRIPELGINTLQYIANRESTPFFWDDPKTVAVARKASRALAKWTDALTDERDPGWAYIEYRGWVLAVLTRNHQYADALPMYRKGYVRGKLDEATLGLFVQNPEFCKAMLDTMTGPDGETVIKLESRFKEQSPRLTPLEFETLESLIEGEKDLENLKYLKTRREFARVPIKLAKGEQITLPLRSPEHCWQLNNASITNLAPDGATLEPAPNKSAFWQVASKIPLQPTYYVSRTTLERLGDDTKFPLSVVIRDLPPDPAGPSVSIDTMNRIIFDLPPGKKIEVEIHFTRTNVECKANGKTIESENLLNPEDNSTQRNPWNEQHHTPLKSIWFEANGPVRMSNINVTPGA